MLGPSSSETGAKMTCIVGLIDGNRVWLGGDSAGVAGLDITVRADPKVFPNGPFLIGFTSSFRMGQLLAYRLKTPARPPEMDIFRFMVMDFVDEVRNCLKDGGYAQRTNDVESGGSFLVGYHGRLFSIQSDYQVCEAIRGYHAIGCGADYALGSLASTVGQPAEQRVRKALECAEQFNGGVRAPFLIQSVAKEEQEALPLLSAVA
jgi:ATP-dependent protease HslVU (ClpYQ) peptidase subunit